MCRIGELDDVVASCLITGDAVNVDDQEGVAFEVAAGGMKQLCAMRRKRSHGVGEIDVEGRPTAEHATHGRSQSDGPDAVGDIVELERVNVPVEAVDSVIATGIGASYVGLAHGVVDEGIGARSTLQEVRATTANERAGAGSDVDRVVARSTIDCARKCATGTEEGVAMGAAVAQQDVADDVASIGDAIAELVTV